MSGPLIITTIIVISACTGFVVVGVVYRWRLTDRGYQRWTQAVGALAVMGLAAVSAWSRRDDMVVAAGVAVAGVALALGYVVLHRRMSARVAELLGPQAKDDRSAEG